MDGHGEATDTSAAAALWGFTPDEVRTLADDGYVVREALFGSDEVAALGAACERLIEQLVADRHGTRLQMGSYVFEPDFTQGVTIKWEGDSDVVHGIEPCAHLSPPLLEWAYDARLVDPMRYLVDDDAPTLFTEKLNLKRAHEGGVNPLHQDYPYWVDVADEVDRVATAMVFLDDATLANGCLQVVPGSHADGVWATRTDGDFFAHNEIDQNRPAPTLLPLEVEAGTVVYFGPYLVHQSEPNRSDHGRRALLYSYQPAGGTHMLEKFRRLGQTHAN